MVLRDFHDTQHEGGEKGKLEPELTPYEGAVPRHEVGAFGAMLKLMGQSYHHRVGNAWLLR